MKALHGLAGLLVLAVIALGYVGFHQAFVWVETPQDLGYSELARRNNYLAAGRYLRGEGLSISREQSLKRLDELPPTHDALFIPHLPARMSAARADRLEAWIRQGGHLLTTSAQVTPDKVDPESDLAFLQRFGLRRVARAQPDMDPALPAANTPKTDDLEPERQALQAVLGTDDSASDEDRAPALTRLEFDELGAPLKLAIDGFDSYFVDDSGQRIASGDNVHGPQLAYYEPGAGQLTVLSDDRFLHNADIAEHDHALFLKRILDGRRLWLLDATEYPGLLELLWRHYSHALIAGGIALLLGLWFAGGRFGPVIGAQPLARRSLLEHLDAAGRHHWRHDRGAGLLHHLRSELESQLSRRHGAWPGLTDQHRLDWLASQSGLSQTRLRAALLGASPTEEYAYLDVVRDLHILRNS